MKNKLIQSFFLVLLFISPCSFSGEIKNSKLAAEIEKNSIESNEANVAYTKKWTDKARTWYQENIVVPQEEAEALGLNPRACYMIKNQDARMVCIIGINAGVKNDSIYCGQMKDSDNRNDCIASVTQNITFCNQIRDKDSSTGCWANLQQNDKLCLSIRNKDAMLNCVASIKHDKNYCLSVRDEDARWGCLAGFPP